MARRKELDTREYGEAEAIEVLAPVDKGDVLPTKGAPLEKNYTEALKFNEEYIDIRVAESTDPNSDDLVYAGVNGNGLWIKRGQVVTIKRKYAESLARSRPSSIRTPETFSPDGERRLGLKKHTNQGYPFSVLRDPNPKGEAWLRNLMENP